MNFNQLGYFLLMFDERSFVAAAHKASLSSQGFTKAIRSLEQEIGVPLFYRDRDGLQRPTAYAEVFRDFCRQTLDAYDKICLRFEGMRACDRPTLIIAAAIGSLSVLGIDFVTKFQSLHPEINVICNDMPDLDAEQALRDGRADVGLIVMPTGDDLACNHVASCERYVWVNADSPLASRQNILLQDLDGIDIAIVGPTFKWYHTFLSECRTAGVSPGSIITSSEMTWLHQFARDGRGAAFTAQTVLPAFENDDKVVAVPMRGYPYEIGVARRTDAELAARTVAFIDYCRPAKGRGIVERMKEFFA